MPLASSSSPTLPSCCLWKDISLEEGGLWEAPPIPLANGGAEACMSHPVRGCAAAAALGCWWQWEKSGEVALLGVRL